MKRLIVATNNQGKLLEIKRRLTNPDLEISSLADFAEQIEVIEDADTFEGNAVKKACEASAKFDCPALSDDSGLEVDALGGSPGVFSARYGGQGLDDRGRYLHLLEELKDIPSNERTARFRAAVAFVLPGLPPAVYHGTLEGAIALAPSGTHGFGYDPVFIPSGYERTLAELGPEIKGAISHRAAALEGFVRGLSSADR